MNLTQSLNSPSENGASAWLASALGQYVLAKEQALFDSAVADIFGFNAVQIGCSPINFLQNSRIPNHFIASHLYDIALNQTSHVYCDEMHLPFAEQSLDLLLLPHKLEFSVNPHQVLREAERILVHEGYLILTGFNPISTWGLNARFKKFLSNDNFYPWCGEFIRLARITDWLALLGFEVVKIEGTCAMLPFEKALDCRYFNFINKMHTSLLSGVYFIVARKRVAGMTPLKPHWTLSIQSSRLVPMPSPSSAPQEGISGAVCTTF